MPVIKISKKVYHFLIFSMCVLNEILTRIIELFDLYSKNFTSIPSIGSTLRILLVSNHSSNILINCLICKSAFIVSVSEFMNFFY